MTVRHALELTRSSSPRHEGRHRLSPGLSWERRWWQRGWRIVAGVDEVGRGAWAGPVVAAAVVLPAGEGRAAMRQLRQALAGVRDSKQLTPRQRDHCYRRILDSAVVVGVGGSGPGEVDGDGLTAATRAAMVRALAALGRMPDGLLIDALRLPDLPWPQIDLIHGEARSLSIAAASIVAKVTRDRIMSGLEGEYPGYGFAQHKGYGTALHRAALRTLGICPVHRRSYAPIRALVETLEPA